MYYVHVCNLQFEHSITQGKHALTKEKKFCFIILPFLGLRVKERTLLCFVLFSVPTDISTLPVFLVSNLQLLRENKIKNKTKIYALHHFLSQGSSQSTFISSLFRDFIFLSYILPRDFIVLRLTEENTSISSPQKHKPHVYITKARSGCLWDVDSIVIRAQGHRY